MQSCKYPFIGCSLKFLCNNMHSSSFHPFSSSTYFFLLAFLFLSPFLFVLFSPYPPPHPSPFIFLLHPPPPPPPPQPSPHHHFFRFILLYLILILLFLFPLFKDHGLWRRFAKNVRAACLFICLCVCILSAALWVQWRKTIMCFVILFENCLLLLLHTTNHTQTHQTFVAILIIYSEVDWFFTCQTLRSQFSGHVFWLYLKSWYVDRRHQQQCPVHPHNTNDVTQKCIPSYAKISRLRSKWTRREPTG